MPKNCEKNLLSNKIKKHLLSSFQESKWTPTERSEKKEKIENVKATESDLELFKIVKSFTEGYEFYDSF